MMTWGTDVQLVEIGTLAIGARFQVAGLGERRGTVLRITPMVAIVAYDRAAEERREPIGIALPTKVVVL
jgi:hypothetical protein